MPLRRLGFILALLFLILGPIFRLPPSQAQSEESASTAETTSEAISPLISETANPSSTATPNPTFTESSLPNSSQNNLQAQENPIWTLLILENFEQPINPAWQQANWLSIAQTSG